MVGGPHPTENERAAGGSFCVTTVRRAEDEGKPVTGVSGGRSPKPGGRAGGADGESASRCGVKSQHRSLWRMRTWH